MTDTSTAIRAEQVWFFQTDCLYLRATLYYFNSMIEAARFADEMGLNDSAILQTSPRHSRKEPGIWRVTIPHKAAP